MKIKLKGGKTAPRLLQDFRLYDPSRLPSSGYNVLVDLPDQYEAHKAPPLMVSDNSCKHAWALKYNQSRLPEPNRKPNLQTTYTISAYCTECRSHLELGMDFRGGGSHMLPCPNEEWPLHHFTHMKQPPQRRPTSANTTRIGSMDESVDCQRFQCTSPRCSARLTIRICPPRLTPEWVNLLSDPNTIRTRAEKAVAENLDRLEGHNIPLPVDVMASLCQYIDNAMNKEEIRMIQGNNKKFLLYFGEPCAELLQFLGFQRQEEGWLAPCPEPSAETPFQKPLNVLLDDVFCELLVLRSKRPPVEQRSSLQYRPISAMNDIMRALGCMDYQRSSQSRTVDLTHDEHPFYAGLGATCDFHDDLIGFAYNRQIDYDPFATPYYLECLQGIGKGRKSEALETLAAIEASKGKTSLQEVRNAYKNLGLDASFVSLDDDMIIGTFQSRISDAPRQESELREALRIIGLDRSSTKIQHVASNVVSNHEQALIWLAATEDTSDDFLLSMYQIKVDECPSDVKTARHAVSLIADYRNSNALKSWLETGVLGEVEMDIGQAYNRFGISDRTIDDDTILSAYDFHVSEAPSQTDDLRSALTAIAKSRNSRLLKSFLNSGMVSSEHPPGEWPVGLENIGNTCYLNSLLQFYFTVKPLREIVLNFDQHKMEIENESLKNKRVGSRKVSKKEIERAQRFVFQLQKLFQNMITAPNAKVTPEQELARLTLISSVTEEHIRRHSILSGHRPSLGEIDGRPVLGPLLPPASQVINLDSEMTGVKKDDGENIGDKTANDGGDGSSETTLVEPVVNEDSDLIMLDSDGKEQQQSILENKENLPPIKTLEARPATPETELQPLAESSPSRTNEQPKVLSTEKETVHNYDGTTADKVHPPNRPPPFPPRPKPEDEKFLIQEEVEIGAQQDVTEVIQNVLFQLQCAIKAESVDSSGEQLDQIKRLFYGKQKSYTTNREGSIRTKEDFFSDIKVDVASGPRSIYAALDGAFDVQEVEVGGALEPQYTTISQLPPVLQIMVQRAQYDPEKKSSFKSTHHLDLIETIYMDRYMDSENEDLMQRRRESWIWKKEVTRLEARKLELTKTELEIGIPQVLDSSVTYLRQLREASFQDEDPIDISDELLEGIESASRAVKHELAAIDDQMKTLSTQIHSQFNDLRAIPYRLHSVFIHRGFVSSGHYWIYIYDFSKKIWRKYNDGYVTEVKDVKEIFEQDPEPRPSTPYFLVYIKDTSKDVLVDPVCRDILEPTQDPRGSQDIEMLDIFDSSHLPELVDTQRPKIPRNEVAPNSFGTWDATSNHASSW